VLPGLTFRYRTFCPQAAFTVSVSLATYIDSISINCVLCNGGTRHLTIIPIHLSRPSHGSGEFTVLSTRRVRFSPGAVHVRFAVDEIAMEHVPRPVLRPFLSTLFQKCFILILQTSVRTLGTFRHFNAVCDKGELPIDMCHHSVLMFKE
jgi:hypothetical protein